MATTFAKVETAFKHEPYDALLPHTVFLTSFFGGNENGRSLQLTLNGYNNSSYIKLTAPDVVKLYLELDKWLTRAPLEEI